jgi:hypothetical protein
MHMAWHMRTSNATMSCLRRYVPEPHGGTAARHAKARELLYGCQDGRLVQLLVDAGAVRQGFVIHGAPGTKESIRSAVTAIHCGADYSKVGLHACGRQCWRQLANPLMLRTI